MKRLENPVSNRQSTKSDKDKRGRKTLVAVPEVQEELLPGPASDHVSLSAEVSAAIEAAARAAYKACMEAGDSDEKASSVSTAVKRAALAILDPTGGSAETAVRRGGKLNVHARADTCAQPCAWPCVFDTRLKARFVDGRANLCDGMAC